ncbi:MAG: methyltransferase domain-containing protein [Raoultibacter sp.]
MNEHTPSEKASPLPSRESLHHASVLLSKDWNAEWKTLQTLLRRSDNEQYWDKRSAHFATKDFPNLYIEDFLRFAEIKPAETIFDMGCGTGSLAIPLAEAGHKVVAADFSQGMLDGMKMLMDEKGVTSIFPKKMSWEEDWAAHGVREGMVDVCVASRSIAVNDLEAALLRLDSIARRRVCITITTGTSPRHDARLLREIGIQAAVTSDYLYAVNILAHNNILPEVRYIESERIDTFDSLEAAFEKFSPMVLDYEEDLGDALPEKLEELRVWLAKHSVENPTAGMADKKGIAQGAYRLDTPRMVTWAFIAWNK